MLALLIPNQRYSLSTSELVIFQLQCAVRILPYTHTERNQHRCKQKMGHRKKRRHCPFVISDKIDINIERERTNTITCTQHDDNDSSRRGGQNHQAKKKEMAIKNVTNCKLNAYFYRLQTNFANFHLRFLLARTLIKTRTTIYRSTK